MNDPQAIQRYGQNLPAGRNPQASLMTPQGPAIIQVIDMPSGLGPVGPGGPAGGGRRPGGINILGAVLRRWWLVVLVTVVVGAVGFVAAQKFVKAKYDAYAQVKWGIVGTGDGNSEFDRQVLQASNLISTDPQIVILAARYPELQEVLPWLGTMDFDKPADQQRILKAFFESVEATVDHKAATIDIDTQQDDARTAAAYANAFAQALVEYCSGRTVATDEKMRLTLSKQCDDLFASMSAYNRQKDKLVYENNFPAKQEQQTATVKLLTEWTQKKAEAETALKMAQAQAENFRMLGPVSAADQLKRGEMIEAEQKADVTLAAAIEDQKRALDTVAQCQADGMTPDHPRMKAAQANLLRAKEAVETKTAEIAAKIDQKVARIQVLIKAQTVEQAQVRVRENQLLLEEWNRKLSEYNKEQQELAGIRMQIDELDRRVASLKQQYDEAWKSYQEFLHKGLERDRLSIAIAHRAEPPALPTEDKRNKVRIAGCVGGLFLGILLALLVDRLDKRLRDPRDVEVLLNAPLLGTIPRIQELKRIKGEQARNLIAEEFRIIRTQLLFGNPQLQYKTMCVTSPAPGDGKTSLAVNLAISIAKAGRRTLLVDGDMRKPDVHRIFNIPDSPGLAELIQGTCEPGAAIRKTDIEFLDVLPAGLPLVRPAELLSRPEMGRLLGALGELYDHVIFDSAPLLPVSDSHVLAGMVAGVIVSLNGETDYDTVRTVEQILRRNHANLIGSVVNQVKYKQSNSYHRGKSVYDSYYNSTRGAAGDGKPTSLAKAEK